MMPTHAGKVLLYICGMQVLKTYHVVKGGHYQQEPKSYSFILFGSGGTCRRYKSACVCVLTNICIRACVLECVHACMSLYMTYIYVTMPCIHNIIYTRLSLTVVLKIQS